jgi:hypothetical protein
MSIRSLLSAIGVVLAFGMITYLVTVVEKRETIGKLLDGLSDITFVEDHKVVDGQVWVQFADTNSHWQSTARSLAVYLSSTIRGQIHLVVASKRQMILAPKDGNICEIVAEHGVVEKDGCVEE